MIAPPRFDDARFWRQVCGILPKVGWKLNCIPRRSCSICHATQMTNSVPLENGRPDAGMTKAGCGAGLSWNVVQCRRDKRGGDLDPSATRQQDTIQKRNLYVNDRALGWFRRAPASCSSRAGIIPRVWRCSSQHPSRNHTAADHRRFRCVTALTAFPPGRPLMSSTRCLQNRFRRKAATARWNSTLHSASRRPRARAPSTSDRARTHRAAPSRSDREDNRPPN